MGTPVRSLHSPHAILYIADSFVYRLKLPFLRELIFYSLFRAVYTALSDVLVKLVRYIHLCL